MAMNKKEQAAMADLQRELAEARAFRFTPLVGRDLPAPSTSGGGVISGWDYNAYYMNAEQAWSKSVAYGLGAAPKSNMSASQGARSLYSTKLLALKAMRNEMERKAARELAKVDALIEREAAAKGEHDAAD